MNLRVDIWNKKFHRMASGMCEDVLKLIFSFQIKERKIYFVSEDINDKLL